MILEEKIENAIMSIFSSDLQPLNKRQFAPSKQISLMELSFYNYREIRCIALCGLQTSKQSWLFLLTVSIILADISGIRLVGGSWNGEGRVEISINGNWGTVCDDDWDITDAGIVCRQLGFLDAVSAPTSAHFGAGSGQIWLDDVKCSGSESSIVNCPHNGWGVENCEHNEDASVICSSKPS